MADEPLIPPVPPALEPPSPTPKKGYVKCDFCGCTLTQGGEVFRMSDEAKGYVKASDKIAELTATVATLRARLQELETSPAPEPEPTRRKGLLQLH